VGEGATPGARGFLRALARHMALANGPSMRESGASVVIYGARLGQNS